MDKKESEELLSDFASGKYYETEEDRKRKNKLLREALEDFNNREELAKESKGYKIIKKKKE